MLGLVMLLQQIVVASCASVMPEGVLGVSNFVLHLEVAGSPADFGSRGDLQEFLSSASFVVTARNDSGSDIVLGRQGFGSRAIRLECDGVEVPGLSDAIWPVTDSDLIIVKRRSSRPVFSGKLSEYFAELNSNDKACVSMELSVTYNIPDYLEQRYLNLDAGVVTASIQSNKVVVSSDTMHKEVP